MADNVGAGQPGVPQEEHVHPGAQGQVQAGGEQVAYCVFFYFFFIYSLFL